MPPRALKPVGVALVDKPAGPSSFALVAALRRRTRARTGHAGTLDPFATGLLLLLSGAATRLAPCFVGLDKRYVTDVDLTSTTTTGDPEGETLEEHAPPRRVELDDALAALARRGRAADSRRVGGEDRRRARVQAGPPRRRRRDAAAPLAPSTRSKLVERAMPTAPTVRLALHVSSGTYVRAIAQALGGHCTSLRRTAIGPFGIDEAAPVDDGRAAARRGRARPPAGREAPGARAAITVRSGVLAARMTVARSPGGAAGRASARSRSAPSTAFTSGTAPSSAQLSTPGSCRRSSRSTRIRGRCSATRSSCSRRSSGASSCSASAASRTCSSSSSREDVAALPPAEFVERYLAAIGTRVVGRRDGLPLRPRPRG